VLLNSASRAFPDGLANRSGLVGKNLMFHPYGLVTGSSRARSRATRVPTGLLDHQPGVLRDRPLARLRARLFVRDDSAAWARSARRCSRCRRAACHGGAVTTTPTRRSGTAPRAWSRSARTCPRSAIASRSTRARRLRRDPRAEIHYRLGENSERMLDHAVARGPRGARGGGREGDDRRRARSRRPAGT
jgi:hypothetical protein